MSRSEEHEKPMPPPGPVAITIDTEWAHPAVLGDLLDLLDEHGVAATLFCTGPVDARGHEVAIHPNFRRGGDAVRSLLADPANEEAASDDGMVYRAVLSTMRDLFPEAVGTRSHSLIHDSALLPELASAGFRYDSSIMIPLRSVEPFPREHGIWEIPIYYMDHVDLMMQATGFRADTLGLEQPGLKVFDFHPNMVFIDASTQAQYERSKSSYHDPQGLLAHRGDRRGVRTLLVDLLERIRSDGIPTRTLGEVYRAVAGGASGREPRAELTGGRT